MSKTLHLNLKKKWFDMIYSGEKKEEYRDTSPYWAVRLINKVRSYMSIYFWKGLLRSKAETNAYVYEFTNQRQINYVINKYGFKAFDSITFSNGYSKDRKQFEIEFKGIEIREGEEKWGAEKGKKYFVIKLGDIIK